MVANLLSIVIVTIIIVSFIYTYLRKSSLALTITVTNFIIFLLMFSAYILGSYEALGETILNLGCRPSEILSAKFYTVFTHLYLHGNIIHILMNMLFLIFIGLAFEERVGRSRFALVYFTAGIFGVLFNALLCFLSPAITPDLIGIGASGAIFGIVCAYAFLYPRDEIAAPLGPILFPRIPVILVAVLYFGIETFYTFMLVQDSVGHIVHVGGAITGICLAPLLKKKLPVKEKEIGFDSLEKIALTPELKKLLAKIKAEEIEDIKRVWLEEFLSSAKCLKCGGRFIIKKRSAECKGCDFKVIF